MTAIDAQDTDTHKYSYRVFWYNPDNCYIAVCPAFKYISASGDTPVEALEELQVALKGAIEVYERDGWPLPEPSTMSSLPMQPIYKAAEEVE